MKLKDLQGSHVMTAEVAGQATAATPDEFTLGRVPFKAKVVGVRFIPKALITGAATNNFAVTVRNRKADASGTVKPASLTFDNGVTAAAFTAKDVTLSATAADLLLNEGDVLTVEKLVNGTGLAMPAGTVAVEIQGR